MLLYVCSAYFMILSNRACLVWRGIQKDWGDGYSVLGHLYSFNRHQPKNHCRFASHQEEGFYRNPFRSCRSPSSSWTKWEGCESFLFADDRTNFCLTNWHWSDMIWWFTVGNLIIITLARRCFYVFVNFGIVLHFLNLYNVNCWTKIINWWVSRRMWDV